jgi:hypothetical protein
MCDSSMNESEYQQADPSKHANLELRSYVLGQSSFILEFDINQSMPHPDPSDAQSWYLLGRAYMAGQKHDKVYESNKTHQQAFYDLS